MTDKKYQVVVIDDNEIVAKAIVKFLKRFDAEIISFTDPVEFLLSFCSLEPDVIFVDHGMPGIKGVALVKRLRVLYTNCPLKCGKKQPRIIGISGWGPMIGDEIIDAGADAFLAKPFNTEQVEDALAGIIGYPMKRFKRLKKQNKRP